MSFPQRQRRALQLWSLLLMSVSDSLFPKPPFPDGGFSSVVSPQGPAPCHVHHRLSRNAHCSLNISPDPPRTHDVTLSHLSPLWASLFLSAQWGWEWTSMVSEGPFFSLPGWAALARRTPFTCVPCRPARGRARSDGQPHL